MTLSDQPASEIISVRFSASAVADLVNDENNFITIIAQNLDPNNAGFNDSTGLGIQSKESGNGAVLTTTSEFLSSSAATQDAYIDFGATEPADGGTGDRLSLATPNPPAAFQYTRLAYFGFDVSDVDFTGVGASTFRAQLADDIGATYANAEIRFTLVSNTVADAFDQTTLESSNAPGLTQGPVVPGPVINGTILGEVVLGDPPVGAPVSVTFPTAAVADLANDSNGFLTVVAEARTENNAGYGNFTGPGFASLESGSPASLDFTVIPEPSSVLLTGLATCLFLRRRRP